LGELALSGVDVYLARCAFRGNFQTLAAMDATVRAACCAPVGIESEGAGPIPSRGLAGVQSFEYVDIW